MKRSIVAAAAAVVWLAATPSSGAATPERPRLVIQTGQFLIRRVAFSADERFMASGSADGSVTVSTTEGYELRSFASGKGYVDALDFSGNGGTVAVGPRDEKIVKVVDVANGSVHVVPGYRAVALNRAGSRLITEAVPASPQSTVALWAVAASQRERTLPLDGALRAARWTPDDRYVAVSSDRTVVYDASSWQPVRTVPGIIAGFSPRGAFAVTIENDTTVVRWSLPTWRRSGVSTTFAHAAYAAAVADDGRVLAAGCDVVGTVQHTVYRSLRDASSETFRDEEGCYHGGNGINVSASGRFYSRGRAYAEEIVDRGKDTGFSPIQHPLASDTSAIVSVGFADAGNTLLTSSFRGDVQSWNLAGATSVANLRTVKDADIARNGARLTAIAVGPRRESVPTYMITADANGGDEGLQLWSYDPPKVLGRPLGPSRLALAFCAFSADGRYFALGQGQSIDVFEFGEAPRRVTLPAGGDRSFADFKPYEPIVALSGAGVATVFVDLYRGAVIPSPPQIVGRTIFGPQVRVLLSRAGDRLQQWDADTFRPAGPPIVMPIKPRVFAYSHGGDLIAAAGPDANGVPAVALAKSDGTWSSPPLYGHASDVMSIAFTRKDDFVVTGSLDRSVRLWDVAQHALAATLVSSAPGDWSIVTPDGHYDASPQGFALMHWVAGREAISFDQLPKRSFHQPYLLSKILSHEQPPSPHAAFNPERLYPELRVAAPGADGIVRAVMRDRGGGVGAVRVFVNDLELAVPRPAVRGAGERGVAFDIRTSPAIVPGDRDNEVRVTVSNADGSLWSPDTELKWQAPGRKVNVVQQLHAIVVGISTYRSSNIEPLHYADDDAIAVAKMLSTGGEGSFGRGNVHIRALRSNDPQNQPTKANLERAFAEAARRVGPRDVFVVYFSGHGVGEGDDFAIPTIEANGLAMDASLRRASVSSKQLVGWIQRIRAHRKLMILDTCAAGALTTSIAEARLVPASRLHAIEDLEDRTGVYVLMGTTADKKSFEDASYRHGILTYALLAGIRDGIAVGPSGDADVASLFKYVQTAVPRLASAHQHEPQTPVVFAREANIVIGRFDERARRQVLGP